MKIKIGKIELKNWTYQENTGCWYRYDTNYYTCGKDYRCSIVIRNYNDEYWVDFYGKELQDIRCLYNKITGDKFINNSNKDEQVIIMKDLVDNFLIRIDKLLAFA